MRVSFPTSALVKAKKIVSSGAILLLLGATFSGLLSARPDSVGAATQEVRPQCSDGIDNDGNGKVDYPQDPGCLTPDDDYEGEGSSGLFVSIRDDKETVAPGDAVVYAITLKQQRDDARVVNVDFDIPYQVNVLSASDGGFLSPTHIRWSNVSVYKNVSRVLTVQASMSPNVQLGQYIIARVRADGAAATDTTLVDRIAITPVNALKISITDDRQYALPGDTLNYTISVRNDSAVATRGNVAVTLPSVLEFLAANDGYVRDNHGVTWNNVPFDPHEEKKFTVSTLLYPTTRDRFLINTRAYTGTNSAVDQTIVRIGLPYNSIGVSLTDNRDTVQVGQELTYVVQVTNASDMVGTNVSVDASVPHYSEFVGATEGGKWDGSNVRWLIFQIAPHETRKVIYTIRVRPDAPIGAQLLAGVTADGSSDRDTTQVVLYSGEGQPRQVLFRKDVDRSEVVPGGQIRYTLLVRNTLDHPITDAVINDRFDGQFLSFVDTDSPGNLIKQDGMSLQWGVPTLLPGQSWQARYTLTVSPDAPNATGLSNIATITGRDVTGVALSEKVFTTRAGVFTDFPKTGSDFDVLAAGVLGLVALAATSIQRKLKLI